MRHQKILKRADGSRVRINVRFESDWRHDIDWSFSVDKCEPRKRTWVAPVSDSYSYRKLPMNEKKASVQAASLKLATAAEIEAAMLEMWEMMRPRINVDGSP